MGVSVLCLPWARWAALSLPAAGPSDRPCEAMDLPSTPCCSREYVENACVQLCVSISIHKT